MDNTIGSQIASLRATRGMTQEDLALKLGYSKQTVSNWETGLKTPRMGAIQKIADFFNVNKSYIIEGANPDDDIKISDMIEFYRKKNNLTVSQLGEKLDKPESTISDWITGNKIPSADDLNKLTQVFNIPIDVLIFGETKDDSLIQLITIMRKLDNERQDKVLDFAKFQLSEQKNSAE